MENFGLQKVVFLNDITEFHVATDVFIEVIERNLNNVATKEKIKNAIYKELNLLIRNDEMFDEKSYSIGHYVISFCLEKDSILMWSEYSDFCGYCIEFDFDKLIHSFSNFKHIIHGKVIYDHQEQISIMEEIIEYGILKSEKLFKNINSWDDLNEINDNQVKHLSIELGVDLYLYNMFFKKECFSGENEYRFVFICDHDEVLSPYIEIEPQYFRVKDNVLIPFVKKKLSSLDSVNSILIGPKNNSDIAEKGVKHFLRYHKIKAKVEKSEMPLRY